MREEGDDPFPPPDGEDVFVEDGDVKREFDLGEDEVRREFDALFTDDGDDDANRELDFALDILLQISLELKAPECVSCPIPFLYCKYNLK